MAFSQAFECEALLRVGQQLAQLVSQGNSFLILQLAAHLLNFRQKCASGAPSITATFGYRVGAIEDSFRFALPSHPRKNPPLSR